jgi:hypothetical protein
MKKTLKLLLTGILISYLLIGIGIDRYDEYKSSQTENFPEGLSREINRYSPSHLISIIFWPFYL